MPNPVFNALSGMNIPNMLAQLKQNPFGLLNQARLNVPTNLNNPQQIIEYLTRTGQINQSQLNQAQQMAQMIGIK